MKKRIITAGICLIVILGMTTTATAATTQQGSEELQPLWIHVANITLSMTCSDGNITWSGLVQGQPDIIGVTATYTLEKRNPNGIFTEVDTWPSLTTDSTILVSSGSATVGQGSYRLTVTVEATIKKGGVERITDSFEKTF